MRRHLLLLFAAVALAACGDDTNSADTGGLDTPASDIAPDQGDATPDAATDVVDPEPDSDADVEPDTDAVDPLIDVWDPIPRTEQQPDADATRWTPGEPVPDGGARLGVHPHEYRHFTGPEARCRPGDFVLENDALSVCIASELRPSQYTYTGGFVIDLAPADRRHGEMLEMIGPGADLRNVFADEFTVVRDGSDGGPAVLRVAGDLRPLMAIANFVGDLFSGEDFRLETEYRLAPGEAAIEVVTWFRATAPEVVRAGIEIGDLLLGGDHITAWAPGFGPIAARFSTETDLWVGLSDEFAYGVWSPEMKVGAFAAELLDSDLDPAGMTRGVLGPTTEANYVRRYTVGRDTAEVRANLAPFHTPNFGEPVTLAGPIAEGYPERRYAIANTVGEVEVARLDDAGTATVQLPAGSYTAYPLGQPESAHATTFDVPTDAPVQLGHAEIGMLRVWVDELVGEELFPSPARVDFTGPANDHFHVLRGAGAIPLPPGEYQLVFSRGEEFDTSHHSVTVTADGEASVNATLTRTMDSDGWVSGDFHTHQRRSIDSTVENTTRVASNVAHGLDFMAPSDHDAVEDFPRIVAEMGLEDLLFTYPGSEISPVWGHTNHFPLAYDPALPGFGSVPLSRVVDGDIEILSGPEMAAAGRALGADIIQVNHPREGSGFLNAADYDPVLGPTETDGDFFFPDFDSVEVVNSPDETCLVMRDWFSFLAHGMQVAGVGNSDSHGLGDPVGWPRNYLQIGDEPISLDAISEAVREMRVSVSGGIFLDFDDLSPGDEIAIDEPGVVQFLLRAQTPSWVSAETLVVYVNGVEVDRLEFDVEPEAIVDFHDTVAVPVERDSFVVFFAFSSGRHPMVTPGKEVFGFTNPIFVDVGGDGWTAPGVADEAALPMPSGIPFCDAPQKSAESGCSCGH